MASSTHTSGWRAEAMKDMSQPKIAPRRLPNPPRSASHAPASWPADLGPYAGYVRRREQGHRLLPSGFLVVILFAAVSSGPGSCPMIRWPATPPAALTGRRRRQALVRHRSARARHLQPRRWSRPGSITFDRGLHQWRWCSFMGGLAGVIAAGFFGGWTDKYRRAHRRYDHGVSAVRAGDGHRCRTRQHRAPTSSSPPRS